MVLERVCVFCGSTARLIGRRRRRWFALAGAGLGVVFGGGGIGLMNVMADAALGLGIEVIGVS